MGRYGALWLVAGLSAGCSSATGDADHDAATMDAVAPSSGRPESGTRAGNGADAGSWGDADDSGSASGVDAASSDAVDPPSPLPASCAPLGAGTTRCGAKGDSCCTSLPVAGGTYDRTYTSSGDAAADEADPASITGFRLDEYEVTVGRFRQFVSAWNGGAGYLPPAGSGRHAHLNGGQGLASHAVDAAVAYETGWLSSDDGAIAPTDASLACESQFATWTTQAGGSETLPINCVNWYEAYAFCIWDGGFLPSEAETEYAAAGGSQQREYPWGGAAPGATNQYAIYGCNYPSASGSCTGGAAPVGTATLGAGRWGQLDLAGNVNEWSLDSFAPYAEPCADCASLEVAPYRVIRGGYFYNHASYLLPAARSDDPPAARSICIGFRCARTP